MFRISPAKSRKGDASYEEGNSGYESAVYGDETSSHGELSLLFEIISCRDLPAVENGGACSPYVKIKVGKTPLYQTATVSKTMNPVFSVDGDDGVILDLSFNSLAKHGIDVRVKHRDSKGRSVAIGSVKLTEETIRFDSGEIREYRLKPPRNKETQQSGYISLRWAPYFGYESDSLVEINGDDEELNSQVEKTWSESDRIDESLGKESYQHMDSFFRDDSTTSYEELLYTQPDEDRNPSMKARLNVMVEIMFCRDLQLGDKISPNPYVKVKVGKRLLYQTKHLANTLNPVFNLEDHPSEFSLIDVSPIDLDCHGGLEIKVKHKDSFGTKNDVFGSTHVTSMTLANAAGLSQEVKLSPPPGREKMNVGYVAFRCRPLTAYEISRMNVWKTPIPQVLKKVRDALIEERERLMPTDTSLLIEIVSCWDLPNPRRTYVKVEQRGRAVHQTKPVPATNEPVFTVQTESLFFLDVLERDFVQSNGLVFKVKDMQKRRRDDLGFVSIPGLTLVNAKGERMEFELEPTEEMEQFGIACKGCIAIRCRRATSYDKEFLKCLHGTEMDNVRSILGIDHGLDKLMTTKGGSSMPMIMAISGRRHKFEKNKRGEMEKLFKVRPMPDPERPAETAWMSHDAIEEEVVKESRHWLDIGTGELGRIFLEVIGADDILNVGSNFGGDKSDAFVTIIYEDCMAKTEVIDDCLSPRWLPWMQRAFIMRIMHTSSNIMIGVFNYHGSLGHEMLGRVAVNFANLRPNMEYLLHYALYDDPNTAERERRGTITLRLRLEYSDQRELVLKSLRGLPKDEYVNVTKRTDFAVARQLLVGKQDLSKYSLKTLRLYAEEIRSYMELRTYLIDSVTSIALWRGRVQLFGVIPFPLNSFVFFVACVAIVERPSLLPCFFVLGIAWFLHYTRRLRTFAPDPWSRTRTFREITQMLLLGHSLVRPRRIQPNQNLKAIVEHENKTRARLRKAEMFASVILEGRRLDKEEQKKLNLEIRQRRDEAEVAAQVEGVSLDPLKPILYPIQKQVEVGIKWLRFARNVILWEEPYYAYFLSTFLIVLGIFFFFIPWAFILRWTMRTIAWGFFGPHMKLVDTFWYKKFKYISSEEKEKLKETIMQGVDKVIEERRCKLRIQKEDADKLRDMKAVFYGNFINKVPMLNMERYIYAPLSNSSAKPYKAKRGNQISCERVVGQQLLMSSMIPEPKTAIGALLVEQSPTERALRLSMTGRLQGEDEMVLRE